MNVQMIWNGTNHVWFKTDKAHKLDENVYVFNKNITGEKNYLIKNNQNTAWII